ncbi:MAG: hypothetical protein AB7V58_10895 [Solirubrobacterales bacterium]
MGRSLAATLALVALASVAGCGSGSGVEEGASVHVYVGSGLCREAREPLSAARGKAGEVEVRMVCLGPVTGEGAGRIDLARQGANARRASEDSAAVAFLEAPGKPARFAAPIVAAAGIGFVVAADGAAGMERVLRAIGEAGGSGSPREKVREALG